MSITTPPAAAAPQPDAIESRSGLDPWISAELPTPPTPTGLRWLGVVGPGIIVLGASIGSGELLLGPAAFVQFGFSLLWVTAAAVFLQTIFNTELMRYTVATGEPVFTGFMRTRPSSTLWAWIYIGLYLLQVGWPIFAANAAGAIFFLFTRRLNSPADATTIYWIGVGMFLLCVGILLVGRRIERTLELLNWALVACILGGLFVLAVVFVPLRTWGDAVFGYIGFDRTRGQFDFVPAGADFVLIGALAAFSGGGGVTNVVLSNWARDKGYGMGKLAGYIPAAIGGGRVNVAHTGFAFIRNEEAMQRWRGWWRIVRADQWGVFFTGALVGMMLPALLYVTFVARGTDIRGPGLSAVLANSAGAKAGALLAGAIALLSAWTLFKTQLDVLEGMVRAITDMLWTGSRRVRAWRGGDIRAVYYTVLAAVVVWGVVALGLARPVTLLLMGANIAGFVFVVASLHLLYLNTTLLPVEVRPAWWRRVALVAMALFYGSFALLSLASMM